MLPIVRRPRRLRATDSVRRLVRENSLEVRNLIYPLFVSEKVQGRSEIKSMPGVYQYSIDALPGAATAIRDAGVPAIILFGIPLLKDESASQAYAPEGVIQRSLRRLQKQVPDLTLITDVCLCEYMSHGHCGLVAKGPAGYRIPNDESVELLCKTAVSHAAAGAHMVAPSDMMDGRIGAIRAALDQGGFSDTAIMSYAAKFSSAFYGPFREAAESAPSFGDRKSYQMDPANGREALREVGIDVEEGADLIIVKPGLPCLDVLRQVKDEFQMPTVVFNISGEYSMIKAAARNGWIDERSAVEETMLAFKRAGADMIITYWAPELSRWLGKY